MGKSRTGPATRIRAICKSRNIDETNVYTKAKKLLEIYRDVCWDTADYADQMKESISYDYCSGSLESALLYLEEFAPCENKERFEEKIQSLFRVKWMVEIVDQAMIKVHDFPLNGELYAEILSMYYLSRFRYSESEILEQIGVERSSYYRRKKEAVTVFGLTLWGGSITEFRTSITGSDQQLTLFDEEATSYI